MIFELRPPYEIIDADLARPENLPTNEGVKCFSQPGFWQHIVGLG